MTKKELGVFVNSLAAFILSFVCIRTVMALGRLVVAKVFGLGVGFVNYAVIEQGEQNERIWHFDSVLSFYSVELFVLLGFMVASFFAFIRSKNAFGVRKMIVFWCFVTALTSFFALVSSGILTRANVYHFFVWLYAPFSVMLVIALVSIALSVLGGGFFSRDFMRFRPSDKSKRKRGYFGLARSYAITAFLPGLLGAVLLYLPNWDILNDTLQVELGVILVFFAAGFGAIGVRQYPKLRNDTLSVPHKKLLVLALGAFVFAIGFTLAWRGLLL